MDQFDQPQILQSRQMALDRPGAADRIPLLHPGSLIDRWQADDVLPTGLGALQQTPQGVSEIVLQIRSTLDA